MASNGVVEGPRRSVRLEPRVHTIFPHPRRHYRLSRTPPAIVRRQIGDWSDQHGVLYLTLNVGTPPAFSMNVHLPSAHTFSSISIRLSCTYCSGDSPMACR